LAFAQERDLIKEEFMIKRISIIVLVTFLFTQQIYAEQVKFVIVHTNDVHSYVEGADNKGGILRLATYLKDIRSKESRDSNSSVLYLDSGDYLSGSLVSFVDKGHFVMWAARYFLKPAAIAVGNHEFDFGRENLNTQINKTGIPLLACNLEPENGRNLLTPYIVRMYNGIKVGIISVTLKDIQFGLNYFSPVDRLKRAIKELEEDVEIIIVISHLGYNLKNGASDIVLAESVDGIDFLFGAHTHEYVNEKINNTYVFQAGNYAEKAGKLEFYYDKNKKEIDKDSIRHTFIDLTKNVEEHKLLKAQYVKYKKKHLDKYFEPAINVNGDELNSRHKLSVFALHALDEYVKEKTKEPVDISALVYGNIRVPGIQGVKTYKDIVDICPFYLFPVRFCVNKQGMEYIIKHFQYDGGSKTNRIIYTENWGETGINIPEKDRFFIVAPDSIAKFMLSAIRSKRDDEFADAKVIGQEQVLTKLDILQKIIENALTKKYGIQ